MSKFSFQNKVVAMVNKWFGVSLETDETKMDELDAASQIQEAGDNYLSAMEQKIAGIQATADTVDTLNATVLQLTADAEKAKQTSENLQKQITAMQETHAKQLTNLKDEVRKELLKGTSVAAIDGEDVNLKEKLPKPEDKAKVLDVWNAAQ